MTSASDRHYLYQDGHRTTLTLGVFNSRYDSGTITSMMYDRANTPADDRAAITDFVSYHGYYHPHQSTLPMNTATAVRFGPKKVMVVGDYRHSRASLVDPGVSAQEQASFDSWAQRVPVLKSAHTSDGGGPIFDIYGLPQGDWFTQPRVGDPNFSSFAYQYVNDPVILVTIPTILPKLLHPLPATAALLGKVNSDPVTFGTHVMAPNTVMYKGVRVRWVMQSGQSWYITNYQFVFSRSAHRRQIPLYNSTSGNWATYSLLPHEQATFTGAFPVHA